MYALFLCNKIHKIYFLFHTKEELLVNERRIRAMANEILYLKMEQNIEVQEPDVFLKDVAKLVCQDEHILARAKALKLYSFRSNDQKRTVISILKIIEMLQQQFPTLTIESLGETDIVLEYVKVHKKKKVFMVLKIIVVVLICFFGTSFTIMSYHNDIGINQLFVQLYRMITEIGRAHV